MNHTPSSSETPPRKRVQNRKLLSTNPTRPCDIEYLVFTKNLASLRALAFFTGDKAMIDRGVHRNAVVVALANKLARIAWVALRKGVIFERSYPLAA